MRLSAASSATGPDAGELAISTSPSPASSCLASTSDRTPCGGTHPSHTPQPAPSSQTHQGASDATPPGRHTVWNTSDGLSSPENPNLDHLVPTSATMLGTVSPQYMVGCRRGDGWAAYTVAPLPASQPVLAPASGCMVKAMSVCWRCVILYALGRQKNAAHREFRQGKVGTASDCRVRISLSAGEIIFPFCQHARKHAMFDDTFD